MDHPTSHPATVRGENLPNVARPERIASAVGGATLAVQGLRRGGLGGILLAVAGGLLVRRGVTGECLLYRRLGVSTHQPSESDDGCGTESGAALRLERSVHVHRPAHELYAVWRRLENLPSVMPHLRTVLETDERRSHWVIAGPAGRDVEWDAEIINDKPGELIAWQSLPGADVRSAGSVRFVEEGGGTRVDVKLEYTPAAGRAGAKLAAFLGADPEEELATSLARFKERTESAQPFLAPQG